MVLKHSFFKVGWVGRTFFYFSQLSKMEAGGSLFFFIFHGFQKLRRAADFFFLLDINTMSGDGTYTHTIFKKCWHRYYKLQCFMLLMSVSDDNN